MSKTESPSTLPGRKAGPAARKTPSGALRWPYARWPPSHWMSHPWSETITTFPSPNAGTSSPMARSIRR